MYPKRRRFLKIFIVAFCRLNFQNIYIYLFIFFLLINTRQYGSLGGTVGLGWLVQSVRNTCMCGNVFAHYKPGGSPIQVLGQWLLLTLIHTD